MSDHLTEMSEAAGEASMLLFRYDLIRARIQRGLSIESVAERMGMSPSAVASEMESVDADPHLSTVRRYAHSIGVLLSYGILPNECAPGATVEEAGDHE